MPAALISAVGVNFAAGANPAGQSVTVPSGASAAYFFWSYYAAGASGSGLGSVTLAGASPAQTFERSTNGTFAPTTGVAVWYNPPAGAQVLDPAWDLVPEEGASALIAFVSGGNTSSWRDAKATSAVETTAVTVTVTTVAGDLVLKYDQRFDAVAGTFPFVSAGWTSGGTAENNLERARLSYLVAAGVSQVCDSENENYSSIVAVSIPEGIAAPPSSEAVGGWWS